MCDEIKTSNLFKKVPKYLEDLFLKSQYPWEILPEIKGYTEYLLNKGIEDYEIYAPMVLVGKSCKIHPSAVIEGPAIIGKNTVLRPNCYLRGNVIIGDNCVIGNSTELKNCILLDNVDVPHYNYVGDSVLGNFSHLGAGVICSNLKGDKTNVVIKTKEKEIKTNLRKVGAFVGDNSEIGCHTVMNPGTVVGTNCRVYPLVSLRGVILNNSIVKSNTNIIENQF